MAAFRGVMSRTRDSPMLHLCEERVIPPFSERMQGTLDWREKEEVTRPLSLLIKPNRNCKAESKLHNYTGLRLSLATTYLTHSFLVSLSLFLPLFLIIFLTLSYSPSTFIRLPFSRGQISKE